MIRIYTASKFERYNEVREFNQKLRELGFEITHDWTIGEEFVNGEPRQMTPAERTDAAWNDFKGARDCDLLILIDDEIARGAMVEVGVALASGREVWIVDARRQVIFDELPSVHHIQDTDEVFRRLKTLVTAS